VIFVESPESVEEMRLINKTVTRATTMANMVEGGRTPLLTNDELEALGFGLVIYPTASTYVTAKAMIKLMRSLKESGTTRELIEEMTTFSEFNELIGLGTINELGAKYGTKREEKTVG
jgi:2-methylisocitrate lyase-like PEP mutase family enzyme